MNTIMRNVLVVSVGSCLMFLAAGAGQIGQILRSSEDVRDAALFKWAGNDYERLTKIGIYQKNCLKGFYRTDEGTVTRITLPGCIAANGLEDVDSVVKDAYETLKTAAWPVSLIVNLITVESQDNKSGMTVLTSNCKEGEHVYVKTKAGDFIRSYPLYKDGQWAICKNNKAHLNGVVLTGYEITQLAVDVITGENAADDEMVKLEESHGDK